MLAFYRARNFAPIWIVSGKAAPRAGQAAAFLQGVAADGLDPADYPTPGFGNADPAKLAADELALTNSVVTFARHASIGRVAFTRVSGAVYYDQKAPNRGRRARPSSPTAPTSAPRSTRSIRRRRNTRRSRRSSPRSATARAPSSRPS